MPNCRFQQKEIKQRKNEVDIDSKGKKEKQHSVRVFAGSKRKGFIDCAFNLQK
jgi:hypothetical protein